MSQVESLIKSNRATSGFDQVESSRVESSQVKSSRVESSQWLNLESNRVSDLYQVESEINFESN